MSNTLTNLIPDIYAAMDVVSRELTGFIPSVTRDPRADQVAQNQTIRIPIAPANTAGKNITPAMADPAAAGQVIGNVSVTITRSRAFPFSWSGEEQAAINTGVGYLTMQQDQIAQAIRAAVNEIELDIANAAYQGASRAFGTAGATPFGTAGDFSDAAQTARILSDNGAPISDRTLVLNTAAGANIRGRQAQVHMIGDINLARQGVLLDMSGMALRESAQLNVITRGTGSGYLVNGALSVGATTIAVSTGTGTILAGDTVTFAGDTNRYVVTSALSGGSFSIGAPGLRLALAHGAAVTVGNNFTPSVAFTRNAILLATRLPYAPIEGDKAIDRMVITDPQTGISFEFAVYPGYRMNLFELGICWGVRVIKSEHIAILLG